MPLTPPPTQWAIFFPFDGFILRDEPDMLKALLFGDATLVSYETLLRTFPDSAHLSKAGAYIAVRRRGVVNTHWFDEDRRNEVFIAEARNRANEVAAVLSVAFLATSAEGYLTGLEDRFQHRQSHLALLELESDENGFLSSSSGPNLDTFTHCDPDTVSLSRSELQTFLNQPHTKFL